MQYNAIALAVPFASIMGTVPGPGKAEYFVNYAYTAIPSPWNGRTPDVPGVRAGQPGGPLYLNFTSGRVGADVRIDGYLY